MLSAKDMVGDLEKLDTHETLLHQLMKLVWEKTSNLEAIQTSYEREVTELRNRVELGNKTIQQLTLQLNKLSEEINSLRESCHCNHSSTQTRPGSSSSRRTPRLSLLKKGGTIESTISASIKGSKSFDFSTKRTLSVASDSSNS